MAGSWLDTLTVKFADNVARAIRLWDRSGTGAGPFEFTHAFDPDPQSQYETVAASATDQVMGGAGAAGDYLAGVLIVPATVGCGAVSIKDGAGSAITIFAGGGTSPLSNLVPFFVPLGIKSTGGAWKVTTGANVSAIGVGQFT